LIGILAYLKSKLWLKNTNLGKNQVPQNVTLIILAEGCNSPAGWTRELFKPSKTAEHLAVSICLESF